MPEERKIIPEKGGAGDRSRTYDLRITNALLYQLSYTGKSETTPACNAISVPPHPAT